MPHVLQELGRVLMKGGQVMPPLVVCAVLLFFGLGYRYVMLHGGTKKGARLLLEEVRHGLMVRPTSVLSQAALDGWTLLQTQPERLRHRLDELFFSQETEVGRFGGLVQSIVGVAPLLGLLGTVTGMIETFDSLGDSTFISATGGGIRGRDRGGALLDRARPGGGGPRPDPGRAARPATDRARARARQAQGPPDPGDALMKSIIKKRAAVGIDLSPIIDMTFLLLIFFMVSTTFQKDAHVEVERPSAKSASTAPSKALRVAIDRQGAVYLDGIPTKVWMLQSKLRDAFRGGADKQVLVIADRTIAIEKVVEVVDQSRIAGASDVTVATDKELGGGR